MEYWSHKAKRFAVQRFINFEIMEENSAVIVEEHFTIGVQALWKVLTEADHMRKWFFETIPSFKPEAGFKTEFVVHSGGRDFIHQWTIVDSAKEKRIVYNWRYKGYAGNSFVYFELKETPDATLLTVRHVGMESFPDTVEEFRKESCLAGWTYFIKERLRRYSENLE